MSGRLTVYSITLFVLVNIFMVGMFAYSYMENIYSDAVLLDSKSSTKIEDVYPSAKIETHHSKVLIEWRGVGCSYDLTMFNKLSNNKYLIVSLPKMFLEIHTNKYYLILMVVLTLNSAFMYYNIVYRRNVEEKQRRYVENKLQFQTTMILTENLHHEMNTPMTVINSKLNRMVTELLNLQDNNSKIQTTSDFKAIEASMIIMRDILDRLKSVKHLKVYETRRTIYEVIKSSCEIIKISTADQFSYHIDETLKEYKIDGKYMKNGEFSGILINHIKNSVEANSNNVTFSFGGFDGNKVTMYIGDNGNGIPDTIRKNIFKENFSSKLGIRGNGLYINKFLIENAKGTLVLLETSNKGTAFELKLHSTKSSEKEIQQSDEVDYDVVKKLEIDIKNKDILFQQFIDSLPDMAWMKDKDGNYVIANRAIKEELLFDSDPIGKNDIELALKAKALFGEDNHTFGEKCANSDKITMEKSCPARFLETGKIKGEMMYLEVNKNVITDHSGNIVGVCGTGRDLTEYIETMKAVESSCSKCSIANVFSKYLFESGENV